MKDFGFCLFGLDYVPTESHYGFWAFSIQDYRKEMRSLLGVYWSDGALRLDLLWMRWG